MSIEKFENVTKNLLSRDEYFQMDNDHNKSREKIKLVDKQLNQVLEDFASLDKNVKKKVYKIRVTLMK